jgi:hypothetical protein
MEDCTNESALIPVITSIASLTLFIISEVLALNKKTKSNGVFQHIIMSMAEYYKKKEQDENETLL